MPPPAPASSQVTRPAMRGKDRGGGPNVETGVETTLEKISRTGMS